MAFCMRSLPALHAACKIDLALAREQRNRAHFAQIHPYRVVRINGLFRRMGGREFFAVVSLFGMEKIGFLIERKSQRLTTFA